MLAIFQANKIEITDHAWLNNKKKHPVTFGDNEHVLTGKEDETSYQSLDYIFTLKLPETAATTRLRAITESCVVEQFKYAGTAYGQISDHYGMSIVID